MGDIHPVAQAVVEAGGQEPMINEHLVDAVENLRVIGHAAQFVHGKLPPRVRSALAELHQPQKDPPRDELLLRRQFDQRRIGPRGHGHRQSAAAVMTQLVITPPRDQLPTPLPP